MEQCYVYILASRSRRLYIGFTHNLEKRVYEHEHKLTPGFTSKYNINRLVYYELYDNAVTARGREQELKLWLRSKKIALTEATNPAWHDLAEDW